MSQDTGHGAMPCDLEQRATDALCHLGAALSVLQMHAERVNSPEVSAVRDLLGHYYDTAHHASCLKVQATPAACRLDDLSLNLQRAMALVQRLNDDDTDDPILYAVGYLLLSARGFAHRQAPLAAPAASGCAVQDR